MSFTNDGMYPPSDMGLYSPHDDYRDADLALMGEGDAWPACRICGWTPDLGPHATWVAGHTFCGAHQVQVDSADLSEGRV